jgi:hypothetical protein
MSSPAVPSRRASERNLSDRDAKSATHGQCPVIRRKRGECLLREGTCAVSGVLRDSFRLIGSDAKPEQVYFLGESRRSAKTPL